MVELPSLDATQALAERWARLRLRFDEEAGERPLVLPDGRFFPDVFRGDAASVGRLVARMQAHAGLDDVPLEVVLVDESGEGQACGTGGCGSCAPRVQPDGTLTRLIEQGEGWLVQLHAAEIGHPVALTALLARLLGHVFLLETLRKGEAPEAPAEATAELAAVRLGFGVLLLEGAHIYSKACGGPSVSQVTFLSAGELALATAFFVIGTDANPKVVRRELSPTQRELFDDALERLRSSRSASDALRRDLRALAHGAVRFERSRPWPFGLFGRKRERTLEEALASDAPLEELEAIARREGFAPARRAPARLDDERAARIRRSVDEALEELRGEGRGL